MSTCLIFSSCRTLMNNHFYIPKLLSLHYDSQMLFCSLALFAPPSPFSRSLSVYNAVLYWSSMYAHACASHPPTRYACSVAMTLLSFFSLFAFSSAHIHYFCYFSIFSAAEQMSSFNFLWHTMFQSSTVHVAVTLYVRSPEISVFFFFGWEEWTWSGPSLWFMHCCSPWL